MGLAARPLHCLKLQSLPACLLLPPLPLYSVFCLLLASYLPVVKPPMTPEPPLDAVVVAGLVEVTAGAAGVDAGVLAAGTTAAGVLLTAAAGAGAGVASPVTGPAAVGAMLHSRRLIIAPFAGLLRKVAVELLLATARRLLLKTADIMSQQLQAVHTDRGSTPGRDAWHQHRREGQAAPPRHLRRVAHADRVVSLRGA